MGALSLHLCEEHDVDQTVLPEIDEVRCTGCGKCVTACEPQALALRNGKAVLARPDLCAYEGGCEPVCPEGAIALPYLITFHPADTPPAAERNRISF
jgi:NAD-dependent dihydropyrimidine dehydrogenase PreA subunit